MKRCFCCCCVYCCCCCCWCSSCYFCCCCSWSQKPTFNVWLKLGQKQMIYWWLMPLSLCWLWCKIIFMSNLTFVMLFELSWCWMVDNYLVATIKTSLNKLLQIVQWKVKKTIPHYNSFLFRVQGMPVTIPDQIFHFHNFHWLKKEDKLGLSWAKLEHELDLNLCFISFKICISKNIKINWAVVFVKISFT